MNTARCIYNLQRTVRPWQLSREADPPIETSTGPAKTRDHNGQPEPRGRQAQQPWTLDAGRISNDRHSLANMPAQLAPAAFELVFE